MTSCTSKKQGGGGQFPYSSVPVCLVMKLEYIVTELEKLNELYYKISSSYNLYDLNSMIAKPLTSQ